MINRKRSYISKQKRKYDLYSKGSMAVLVATFIIWIIYNKRYDHAVNIVDLSNISKYSNICIALAICILIETIVTGINILIRWIYEINYPTRQYHTKDEQKKIDQQIIDDINNDIEF